MEVVDLSLEQNKMDNCYHSQTEERRCATDAAGETRCELLRRVWRHCPGKPAEEVRTERSEVTGDEALALAQGLGGGSLFSENGRGGWSMLPGWSEPHDARSHAEATDPVGAMFSQLERQMEAALRGLGGFGGMQQMPQMPRRLPPNRPAEAPQQLPASTIRVDEV